MDLLLFRYFSVNKNKVKHLSRIQVEQQRIANKEQTTQNHITFILLKTNTMQTTRNCDEDEILTFSSLKHGEQWQRRAEKNEKNEMRMEKRARDGITTGAFFCT